MSTMWTYGNLLVDFVLWLFIAAIASWIVVNLYFVCFGYQGRRRMNRGVNALLTQNLRRLNMPQLAYIAGGRFQGFRVQLSVLNRELERDDPPPIEVGEVPEIHPLSGPASSAEEINELPAGKYRLNLQNESTSEQGSSSSASVKEAAVVLEKCGICMDFLCDGDLFRTLPCDHQFHVNCIDPWLKRRSFCPVCKIPTTGEFGKGGSIPFGDNDTDIV